MSRTRSLDTALEFLAHKSSTEEQNV
jgi:ATP-dependent DNA helicase DinG